MIRFYFILLILPIACTSINTKNVESIFNKSENSHYIDKINYLNFENWQQKNYNDVKNKVALEIQESVKQNTDALILNFGTNNFFSNNNTSFKDILTLASSLTENNNLQFLLEINFNEITDLINDNSKRASLKNQIHDLVMNYSFEGFYFSELNFSSQSENDFFEDFLVESMIVKPFLVVSISKNIYETNTTIVNDLLSKGIIDFVIDNNNYTILSNEFITIDSSEKLLAQYLKRISPKSFVCLNLSELSNSKNTINIVSENKVKALDNDCKINFFHFAKGDTLNLAINSQSIKIPKNDWVLPFNYQLDKDYSSRRYGKTWVEIRRSFDKKTSIPYYSFLCKTNYPSEVFINGEVVKIYKTGVFFKKVKLNEGLNKIRAEVKSTDGNSAIYEDRVLYIKEDKSLTKDQLAIVENSILPAENLTLLPEDNLKISFEGTKFQKGVIEISPGNFLYECIRKDLTSYSRYEIQIPLNTFSKNINYRIKYILKPVNNSGKEIINKVSDSVFQVKDFSEFPLLITNQNSSLFYYTLSPIRLGAPLRNELPKDVILKSNGKFGNYYRIFLNESEVGYISNEYVQELPIGSVKPSYFINPIICYQDSSTDVIRIPYLERVPYDVYPDPEQKRITINLYGVETSSTWIIHRTEPKLIKEITWQQTSKETYKIYINLTTSKIWGYEIKPVGNELVFKLKHPPKFNLNSQLPLDGLKISIEAGHGGSNIGAVGLSGLKEKDINLKLSLMIEEILKKNGAKVLQVRDSDRDMSLVEKRDLVTNSDANIHLSIHANASEPPTEFLGTSGTCTFYHNPYWAPLAETIYFRLLELNLKPFGSVGSFNYRVTRMSEMPAILVEQAFLSHAEDEEKLADDNFRWQMAEKIYLGLLDYLKYMAD